MFKRMIMSGIRKIEIKENKVIIYITLKQYVVRGG